MVSVLGAKLNHISFENEGVLIRKVIEQRVVYLWSFFSMGRLHLSDVWQALYLRASTKHIHVTMGLEYVFKYVIHSRCTIQTLLGEPMQLLEENEDLHLEFLLFFASLFQL